MCLPAKRADVTFPLKARRHPNLSGARIKDRSGITQLEAVRGPFTVSGEAGRLPAV